MLLIMIKNTLSETRLQNDPSALLCNLSEMKVSEPQIPILQMKSSYYLLPGLRKERKKKCDVNTWLLTTVPPPCHILSRENLLFYGHGLPLPLSRLCPVSVLFSMSLVVWFL